MRAQVKPHNGTPTLFLDGKPAFYALMWGAAPTSDGYALEQCARRYAEAGIHFHAFDVGTQGAEPEWRLPPSAGGSPFDFSTLKRRLDRVIRADPEARFHLRVHLEARPWWTALHPEECELLSNGTRACQSYASGLWRREAQDFLHALVDAVSAHGLQERVLAYQVGAGHTGEWVKGEGSMAGVCGDFSSPMAERFRNWLREVYRGDVEALRSAWGDAARGFDGAEVPGVELQLHDTRGCFRDPVTERRVVDYYRSLAELCGELVVELCGVVKQATGRSALAGAFYGYLMELAWNAGFFGEGAESPYGTTQRSGHLGLARVLESKDVDFLVSPYSYGFRGVGGHGPSMLPSESVRLSGKLYVYEDDTRTLLSSHNARDFGRMEDLRGSIAILRRNLAYVLTHGHGIWWLAGGPGSPHVDPAKEPGFAPELRRFHELGELALSLDRSPCAEVAVLLDDESLFWESARNDLDLSLIYHQRLWGLARMGAPYDTYLLGDLLAGRLKPYKFYVFLNAFHLDASRRRRLSEELRRRGQTALWIYAPGYTGGDPTLADMTELTGFRFGVSRTAWTARVHVVNRSDPLTRELPADLSWGGARLSPVFHVEDPESTTLGEVVCAQGRCRPGFAVKRFPEWTSVYAAAPDLPAPVLRAVARSAGVHIYSDDGDVLEVSRDLLAIHSATGGARRLRLARRVEVVYELFEGRTVARDTDVVDATLAEGSTALYFIGDKARMSGLTGA